MTSTAGHAAEPSLSLHPRIGRQVIVCTLAAGLGAMVGSPTAATLAAAAVAVPAVIGAIALAPIGRQPVRVAMALALAAPCVRLLISVVVAATAWLALSRGAETGSAAALSFWSAFMLAALGTLAVETLGFAADFRKLAPVRSTPATEAAPA